MPAIVMVKIYGYGAHQQLQFTVRLQLGQRRLNDDQSKDVALFEISCLRLW